MDVGCHVTRYEAPAFRDRRQQCPIFWHCYHAEDSGVSHVNHLFWLLESFVTLILPKHYKHRRLQLSMVGCGIL